MKGAIYALLALGFAGLIGAHEITPADENADMTWPRAFLLLRGLSHSLFGDLPRGFADSPYE